MSISSITVLGAGVIGASWAALFIANNHPTTVYDTNPDAESALLDNVQSALSRLSQLSRYQDLPAWPALRPLLSFTTDLATAVQTADLIQENTPEILQLKLDLYQALENALPTNNTTHGPLICSSSSGFCPSQLETAFQDDKHASNFLIAHPFNPPHLIPLIEVVAGPRTTPRAVARAMDFYTSLGKRPIHLRKETPGHIANRLQAALFREIFSLLESGTAEVADIETAMEYGPGLRWGVMGPSLLMHLGGGPGGARDYARKFLQHLMSWYAVEDPVVHGESGEALVEKWIRGTEDVAANRPRANGERDDLLIGLLNAKE